MDKKEYTGVWLPKEVIESQTLNDFQKILYGDIASFEVCFKTNETFAKQFGKDERTISRHISALKEEKFIVELEFDGRLRRLQATPIYAMQTRQDWLGRVDKNDYADTTKLATRDNNRDNNENIKRKQVFAGDFGGVEFLKKTDNRPDQVIRLFKGINENVDDLYANKTQRGYALKLFEKYGAEQIEPVLQIVKKYNVDKFTPPKLKIYTPKNFYDYYNYLRDWAIKTKNDNIIY